MVYFMLSVMNKKTHLIERNYLKKYLPETMDQKASFLLGKNVNQMFFLTSG